jgi:hypothetical protein
MDPLAKFALKISPEKLAKGGGGIGILFFTKIILPDVKVALLDPWGREELGKKSLMEKNGSLHFVGA